MESVLNVVQIVISVVLIFLVLLHSGKDAGLSGAFGIGQSGSSIGGGSLVERNLDRWTIFFAVLFVSTRSSCSRSDDRVSARGSSGSLPSSRRPDRIACSLALAACSDSGDSGDRRHRSTAQHPGEGGILRWALPDPIREADPLTAIERARSGSPHARSTSRWLSA